MYLELQNSNRPTMQTIDALSDVPCEFRMDLDWPCSPDFRLAVKRTLRWEMESTSKWNFVPYRFSRWRLMMIRRRRTTWSPGDEVWPRDETKLSGIEEGDGGSVGGRTLGKGDCLLCILSVSN